MFPFCHQIEHPAHTQTVAQCNTNPIAGKFVNNYLTFVTVIFPFHTFNILFGVDELLAVAAAFFSLSQFDFHWIDTMVHFQWNQYRHIQSWMLPFNEILFLLWSNLLMLVLALVPAALNDLAVHNCDCLCVRLSLPLSLSFIISIRIFYACVQNVCYSKIQLSTAPCAGGTCKWCIRNVLRRKIYKWKKNEKEMRWEQKTTNTHSLTCSIKINGTMGTNSLIKALIVNTVWMDNAFFWLLRYYPVTGTVFTSTPYRRYCTVHTNSIWISFDVQFNLVLSYLLLQRFSLFKIDSSFFPVHFLSNH